MTEPRCVLFHDNFQNFKSYTGGGNVPLVLDGVENSGKEVENSPAVTLKIRSGCEGGGKGAIWQEEKSATLGCNNDQTVFVPTRHHRFCRCHCHHAKHRQFLQTALDREYGRHRKCVVFYPRCRYPNLHVCCSHKDAGQNKICSYSSPFTT